MLRLNLNLLHISGQVQICEPPASGVAEITGMYHLTWLILVSKEMGMSLMLSLGFAVDGNMRINVEKKVSKVSPCQLVSIVFCGKDLRRPLPHPEVMVGMYV